ncbi:MAG TPA: hypothetical protein VFB58_00695 [Chloroflexota bacterium]|nr:hypothetical protein [Chloroflexota bacterium]
MTRWERYLTAIRYSLLEQARNRLAIGLLILFVPFWYYIDILFTTPGEMVSFKFQATGSFLHLNARQLTTISSGMDAITLIVGFMIFSATRRDTPFDRRLVLSGFPRPLLIAARLTSIVAVALGVSLYTTGMLVLFWHHGMPISLPIICLSFLTAALTYGALGLLLGLLVNSELPGFFGILMLGLIDTFIQNPVGNPTANQPIIKAFPSYGSTQFAVAGGFTHVVPWGYLLLSLLWIAGFSLAGLAVFTWKTRSPHVQAAEPKSLAGPVAN